MKSQSLLNRFQGSISAKKGLTGIVSVSCKIIATNALFALFLAVLSCEPAGPSFGATYYVSATSTNTAWSTCTSSSTPCTPVTAMKNAQAGDVVNFLAGTYNLPCNTSNYEDSSLEPSNSGTSGKPITFQAAPGASVTLIGNAATGSGCDDGGVIGVNGKAYITISGFTIDTSGFPASNIRMSVRLTGNPSYVTIENNTIIGHTTSVSDNYGGIYIPQGSNYVTIQNNKIYGWLGPTGGNGIGGMFDCTNTTIANNEIYGCNGHGILNKQGGGNINIYYNYIHDIGPGARAADCMHVMSQRGESVNSINFYQNICANYGESGNDGGGFHIDASSNSSGMYFNNMNVYNNVFYNSGQSEYAATNNTGEYYNNVEQIGSYGNSNQMFITKVQNGITATGLTVVDYNCYYDPGGTPNWLTNVYGSSPHTYSWSQWQAAGYDAHGLNTNPLFVNTSGGPTGFKLQGGSPCGKGRGGPMGAYITGNETIGTKKQAIPSEIPNPRP